MTVNRLILGDNLEILKSMEKDSVDLIYLDPHFSATAIMKLSAATPGKSAVSRTGGPAA